AHAPLAGIDGDGHIAVADRAFAFGLNDQAAYLLNRPLEPRPFKIVIEGGDDHGGENGQNRHHNHHLNQGIATLPGTALRGRCTTPGKRRGWVTSGNARAYKQTIHGHTSLCVTCAATWLIA